NYVPETERVIDHAAVAERFQPAISRPEPADILVEPLVSQPESPYIPSDGEEDPPGPSRRRRDLAIGTAVGLILTACVAGYLKFGSSQRSDEPRTDVGFPVTLAVTPPSASVSLDGKPIGRPAADGRLGFTISRDGDASRWLEVTADGFHEVRRPISIDGQQHHFDVILIRKPYDLVVRSEPASAEVWLNDGKIGETPVSISVPPTLTGHVTVMRAGYRPITLDLTPPSPGDELAFDLVLEAAAPVIRVESDPPGAQILADGRPIGVAPANLELPRADWGDAVSISATMNGYDAAAEQLQLPERPGVTPTVQFHLIRALIQVTVNTDPPGGTVTVEGRSLGQAPVVASFSAERSGQSVVFEGMQPGERFGSASLRLPGVGGNVNLSIPMQDYGPRVVFVYVPPAETTVSAARRFALADRVLKQVHLLRPSQEFAMLTYSGEGVEAWPGGTDLARATSEQKVRAFDRIRSTRPVAACSVARLAKAARSLDPDVVWMFLPGGSDLEPLRGIDLAHGERPIAINVVTTPLGPDQSWLAEWTVSQRGILSVIDGSRDAILAGEIGEGEQ
ncbi:MAG: PEGA domain-containing protein, partial [Planctomycetota bacterium]|nr:PEGA domain-containing protein [Planctomycetota bacterium]